MGSLRATEARFVSLRVLPPRYCVVHDPWGELYRVQKSPMQIFLISYPPILVQTRGHLPPHYKQIECVRNSPCWPFPLRCLSAARTLNMMMECDFRVYQMFGPAVRWQFVCCMYVRIVGRQAAALIWPRVSGRNGRLYISTSCRTPYDRHVTFAA